jgi:hypothetical protein
MHVDFDVNSEKCRRTFRKKNAFCLMYVLNSTKILISKTIKRPLRIQDWDDEEVLYIV